MITTFKTKNIRVGLIGLGDHALEQLLPALKITPGLELIAISSRTPEKLNSFAEKFQPKFITNNWEDILDTDLIDAVIVSSSPELHFTVAKACIAKNIHVFIEKPPTQNFADLKELVKLKAKSLSKTFVGYNFAYSDAYNKLTDALKSAPLKLAKFKFITAKPDTAIDGFATVLDSGLYKMLVHPLYSLYNTFGEVKDLQVLDTTFGNNKFSQVITLNYNNGANAVLEWGNYSNRFECRFELTNSFCETGVLDNMGNYEFWNLSKYSYEKNFKNKERIVFDNSPLMGGFERTGYQRELELWRDAISNNTPSPCELDRSIEIYRVIDLVRTKSTINF